MSEPIRYAILGVCVEPSYNTEEVTSPMIAVPNGAWVRHEDYACLQAEVERLKNNCEYLDQKLDEELDREKQS